MGRGCGRRVGEAASRRTVSPKNASQTRLPPYTDGVLADQRPTVTVVVPVYNSQATVAELVSRVAPVLDKVASAWEVILVDDGSGDGSWDEIVNIAQRESRVISIRLNRNYGQHNALLCGIRAARHSTIVTLDDDLQHPPEEIGKLLTALTDEYDVVYGTPSQAEHGLWRNLASNITKLGLRSSMGIRTARDVSAFRAFRARLANTFADFGGPFVSIDVLLTWATTRFTSVAVEHRPRTQGRSNYTFIKLIVHALNMTTGFSTWPLRLASLVGFAFTLFGMLLLTYVVGRTALSGGSVPGFPFLASAIAIFSGAQLFALGIMGEYMARMYTRTMARPAYSVWEQSASHD